MSESIRRPVPVSATHDPRDVEPVRILSGIVPATQREKLRGALQHVQIVLEDTETGAGGWGPDQTMVPHLRRARDLLLELVAEGDGS